LSSFFFLGFPTRRHVFLILFLGNFLVFGIAYYSFIFLKQKKELCPPCVCGIPDGLCYPLVILEQQKEKEEEKQNKPKTTHGEIKENQVIHQLGERERTKKKRNKSRGFSSSNSGFLFIHIRSFLETTQSGDREKHTRKRRRRRSFFVCVSFFCGKKKE
jgi:hypothetical protein